MLCAQKQLPTPVAEAAAAEERENKDIASCQLATAANLLLTGLVKAQALAAGSETLGKATPCYSFFPLCTKQIVSERPTKQTRQAQTF